MTDRLTFIDRLRTLDVMLAKLRRMGGRVSGLEQGLAVRGTNSRGAKDIAALGDVMFESIAADNRWHRFDISAYFEYSAHDSVPASEELRQQLGLGTGTGTRSLSMKVRQSRSEFSVATAASRS